MRVNAPSPPPPAPTFRTRHLHSKKQEGCQRLKGSRRTNLVEGCPKTCRLVSAPSLLRNYRPRESDWEGGAFTGINTVFTPFVQFAECPQRSIGSGGKVNHRSYTSTPVSHMPCRDMSKYYCWDARIAKLISKGKAHASKMDAILTYLHLEF